MSWPTLDDVAYQHRKQLAAGAKACWLWTCGLCYCERQETKDGFIPAAIVKLLYPGLGTKEAQRLVEVGLWERASGGYLVHEYLWWRERRFGLLQAERGARGGSVSSEAKRLAALDREARKRIAQQPQAGLSSTDHNEKHNEAQAPTTENHKPLRSDPIRTDPILPTTSDLDQSDPGRETMCPTDLYDRAEQHGLHAELAERLAVPIESLRAETRDFVGYWTFGAGAGKRRTSWMRQLRERLRKRAQEGQLKPPGLVEHESKTAPSPYLAEVQKLIAQGGPRD